MILIDDLSDLIILYTNTDMRHGEVKKRELCYQSSSESHHGTCLCTNTSAVASPGWRVLSGKRGREREQEVHKQKQQLDR